MEVAAAPAPAPPAAEAACREAVAAGGGVDLEEMKVRTKLFVLLACLAPLSFAALPKDQQIFTTPEAAVQALVKAAQAKDTGGLVKLFGPLGEPLIHSG